MALSTSFVTGWFFYGQFFDHAVGGRPVDTLPRGRPRSSDDVARGRGKLHVTATPAELIALVAKRMIDSDDPQEIVDELYSEMAERFIDWELRYAQQVVELQAALRAKRDAWMERRRASLGVH
jgi:hypothetical protein